MTLSEVRSRFLAFYKARGHAVIPSAPIVPESDPTTLFTSSGMQPLVPYLMGQPHPEGTRLVDAQLSFRAEDIEEVGDNRHTTFFEMLGNWSLGDYFKAEQLPWVFEFLTDDTVGLGLDPQKLYVTVFGGDVDAKMEPDNVSVDIWRKLFSEKGIDAGFVELGTEERGGEVGMQGGRIFSFGAKKNWWSRAGVPAKMPVGEIGGPDSEIFYDFGTPHNTAFGAECHPNCDCGRFIEVGNSVFMQFIKKEDGSFGELPKQNVDFGGGLERLTAATRGSSDVFLNDVFDAARAVLEKRSGTSYTADERTTRSFRIVLDHMRAASFMLASGITPGNTEQGYVLRRLIRRSILEIDKLGINGPVLVAVAEGFGLAYADQYPLIKEAQPQIKDELSKEEIQFRKTLVQGLREFDKFWNEGSWISGTDAFILYSSYGFPLDLTREMARERGEDMNEKELMVFSRRMEAHQAESRAGAAQKFAGGLADHAEQTVRYHTAHHLLLKALQHVLGPDVHQRGSNITTERLRIDFSYGEKMTPEQKLEVERIVNEKIQESLPVIRSVMPKTEAEKLSAEHEFGATYPEQVSVYSIGPKDATQDAPQFESAYSIEFCGGPHVTNTSDIATGGKKFVIQKEEASSAGVRRIKAVLV